MLFVGLNAGWNVMPDRFIYGVSPDIVLCPRGGCAGRRGR